MRGGAAAERAAWWWAVAGVLAFGGVACAWVLTRPTPVALGGDNETLIHPLLTDAFRHIRSGRFPLWSEGRWGGSPLAGDPVAGALYAPYYLGYVLTPFPHWRALDVALCLHLVVVALGTLWLLAGLEVRPAVAAATALLVALNPTLVYVGRSWATYWAAIAYWPWLWGAAARLARRPTLAHGLAAAMALAVQVYAGYAQFALYSGTVALLWIAAAPAPARGTRIAVALLVGALGMALAAPQILPGLDMAHESIRAGERGAANLAAMDAVFKLPTGRWADVLRSGPLSGAFPYRLALPTALLALAGAGTRRFVALFLAAAALTAAGLAAGPEPVFRVLRALPAVGFFAGPVKFVYVAIFAATVLAGLGLERLCSAPPAVRRLAAALLALASLPAAAAVLPSAALGAGVVVVVLAAVTGRAGTPLLVGLAAGQAACSFAASGALHVPQTFPPGRFAPLLRRPPAAAASADGRWLALEADGGLRQVGGNYGALWGVEALNGVGPLAQWRQLDVMEDAAPDRALAFVRQLGPARVVVTAGGALETEFRGAGFSSAGESDGLRILAPPAATPRYLVAPHVHAASALELVAAGQRGEAVDGGTVMIEVDAPPAGAEGDPHGQLDVVARQPGVAVLRVRLDRPTWLLAREPYYRNWRATVDGRPAVVHPAAGFFLALLVESGTHVVTLAYHEPGVRRGLIMALVVGPLLAALLRRAVRAR